MLLAIVSFSKTSKAMETDIYFAGGDGSSANPYRIATYQQLNNFQILINNQENNSNANLKAYAYKNYCLTADIDVGNNSILSIGKAETPFYGTFDGNGYRISSLSNAGLFGCLGDGAVVKNMTIDKASISSVFYGTASENAGGGITAFCTGTVQIENCRLLNSSIKSKDAAGG